MAQLVVRDLPEAVKAGLKERASARGRSLEAEVREILCEASKVIPPSTAPSTESIVTRLLRLQAENPIPDDVWEAFQKNLRDVRRSTRMRKVDFPK